ncbi:MAG: YfiR family protein [Gammaproteobacteria bacterium]|nr:YfiR family protein [Gammaproteobacteria bacterium]
MPSKPATAPRRRPPALLAGLLALAACLRVDAAPPTASEAAIKAAYVFNVVKFTEWPDAAFGNDDDPLVICTDARGEQRSALDSLVGKQTRERSVAVRGLPDRDLTDCHVAVIEDRANDGRLGGRQPVLTITTFDHAESMVHVFVDGRRLRFAVRLPPAKQAAITFSAKLLGVAATVHE